MLRTPRASPAAEAAITSSAGESALLRRRREVHENTSAAIRCVVAAETYKLTGRLPVWASET